MTTVPSKRKRTLGALLRHLEGEDPGKKKKKEHSQLPNFMLKGSTFPQRDSSYLEKNIRGGKRSGLFFAEVRQDCKRKARGW